MSEKMFEGYKIICAYIEDGTPENSVSRRKGGRQRLYNEICLTLEPIGCANPQAHDIWEKKFNELAKQFQRFESQEGTIRHWDPWEQITSDDKEGVRILRVSGTTVLDIKRYQDDLKQLVENAYKRAQKEIDKLYEKKKHIEEDRQQLKELEWG